MFEAGKYRDQAALAHSKADSAPTAEERTMHRHRARSLDTLADNELWLAENLDKTMHHAGRDRDPAELAAEETHVIQCLGAAVIMQWDTLPVTLQRELFDTAGAMGDLTSTPALRGQIARFLHKHKGGAAAAGQHPSEADAIAAGTSQELYRSNSGDRWLIGREAGGGQLFVRHEPNPLSGGRPSQVRVEEFLCKGGRGPEVQALLHMLATDATGTDQRMR